MSEAPIDRLVRWVREREAIRARKERGDAFPWTDDPILREWRFCNVRREDDRVTRWIDANIRRPHASHPHLWLMLCAARQINWPGTLAFLMGDPDGAVEERMYPSAWPDSPSFEPSEMGEAMDDIASMGMKVFTGAYIITAPQTKGSKKTTHVAEVTLGALWRDREKFASHLEGTRTGVGPATLRNTAGLLQQYSGWGPFLAHQAVVDMRHTPLLSGAPDAETWTAAGPGSTRGLNRLLGHAAIERPFAEMVFLREVTMLREVIRCRTGMSLDASDVQNCLCEFDKYERVRLGEGEPRARYVPGRGC
jgi:hypothetical protein